MNSTWGIDVDIEGKQIINIFRNYTIVNTNENKLREKEDKEDGIYHNKI